MKHRAASLAHMGRLASWWLISVWLADARLAEVSSPSSFVRGIEQDAVSVAVVTWNLGAKSPSEKLDCGFLKSLASSHDFIVMGCQEVEEVKPRRVEGRRSRYLYALARRLFSKKLGFRRVWRLASGGIHMIIATKLRQVSLAASTDVACGVGNVWRNKGAVCALVDICGAKLALATAHLAAHAPRVAERNADYKRIASELWSAPTIFCGDLNYRLEGLSRAEVEVAIDAGRLDELFDDFDQLTRERCAKRAFDGYIEARPRFRPTFKFDRRSNAFDSSRKRRVPAWTDRVLFTPSPGLSLQTYRAVPDATHSDHRPVVATFEIDPIQLRRASAPKRIESDITTKSISQAHRGTKEAPGNPPHLPVLPDDDDPLAPSMLSR